MSVKFQQTGNQIQIPIDEMLGFVQDKLNQYDELIKATETVPESTPYKDPIYYSTQEGKMVQIPPYVQKQAVDIHMKQKIGGVQNNHYDNHYDNRNLQNNNYDNRNLQNNNYDKRNLQNNLEPNVYDPRYLEHLELIEHKKNKKSSSSSNTKVFLIVVAILILLYFFYKNYK
jgi:hypothetical protein